MGKGSYFLKAVMVAAAAYGGYYAQQHVRLPDWYWEARLPPGLPAASATWLQACLRRRTSEWLA